VWTETARKEGGEEGGGIARPLVFLVSHMKRRGGGEEKRTGYWLCMERRWVGREKKGDSGRKKGRGGQGPRGFLIAYEQNGEKERKRTLCTWAEEGVAEEKEREKGKRALDHPLFKRREGERRGGRQLESTFLRTRERGLRREKGETMGAEGVVAHCLEQKEKRRVADPLPR